MKFKVRKGLETNFLIYGCSVRYFYILCGVVAGTLMLVLTDFMTSIKSGHISIWLMHVVLAAIGLGIVWSFFKKNSVSKRNNFKKIESTISNKDILNKTK